VGHRVIATERLILRPWAERDREAFAAMNADPAVMAHFPKVLDRAESDALLARLMDRWRGGGIAFGAAERRSDGALVGMVGLARVLFPGPVEGSVEIGWRLARAHWGRGYATEAAGAWLAHGFSAMGLREVVAFAVPENSGVSCGDGTARHDARPGARLPSSEPAGGPSAARAHGLVDRPGGVATGPGARACRRAGRAMSRDPIDRSGLRPAFWRRFPLDSLPRNEWEALCDGCAKCCLIKLEDEDTGHVAYTDGRLPPARPAAPAAAAITRSAASSCLAASTLDRDNIESTSSTWLPETCAYRRLIHEGGDLGAVAPARFRATPTASTAAGISHAAAA
jgi:RimJ/RimL family protein N-acetyltransferase/uncharacterized cysteine cluster protein YcgN (CxxCxxCC family)